MNEAYESSDFHEPSEASATATEPILVPERKSCRWVYVFGGLFVMGVVAFCVVYMVVQRLDMPPEYFPVGEQVVIESGTPVRIITEQLQAAGIVRSSTLLYFQLSFFHDTTDLKASAYVFDEPLTSAAVAARLTEGDFDTDLVRITHIEGERVSVFAERAAGVLPGFDAGLFEQIAEPYEGKLFPETYFIPPTYTEEELLTLLTETFDEFVLQHQSEIEQHPLSLGEIIILASIIEREANSPESMKMVSGILQNRLEINMPFRQMRL
jgi:UPF0755 protein